MFKIVILSFLIIAFQIVKAQDNVMITVDTKGHQGLVKNVKFSADEKQKPISRYENVANDYVFWNL